MAEPYISEIRMFGFNWPPRGWAKCDGQLLPINQNQSLYALLGTTYGGDGQTTFALPDLRGRTPINFGDYIDPVIPGEIVYQLGSHYGKENVTLSSAELAAHTHIIRGTTENSNSRSFTNAIFATAIDRGTGNPSDFYGSDDNLVALNPVGVTQNGGGEAHYNMQPSLVVNFCISLTGVFPSRN
ncbi:phage tail protein [Aliikangiella maris]|uniref:Tail fiber protein n=2 Tax=Aliikangiella maris TaxID=3162458 RepID=A0ABV3MNA6_9GAMM